MAFVTPTTIATVVVRGGKRGGDNGIAGEDNAWVRSGDALDDDADDEGGEGQCDKPLDQVECPVVCDWREKQRRKKKTK